MGMDTDHNALTDRRLLLMRLAVGLFQGLALFGLSEAAERKVWPMTDPPVFIGASDEEFIPLAQSTEYAARLAQLGVSHELVTVPGTLHSIGILDSAMRTKISGFLHRHLGS